MIDNEIEEQLHFIIKTTSYLFFIVKLRWRIAINGSINHKAEDRVPPEFRHSVRVIIENIPAVVLLHRPLESPLCRRVEYDFERHVPPREGQVESPPLLFKQSSHGLEELEDYGFLLLGVDKVSTDEDVEACGVGSLEGGEGGVGTPP